MKRARTCLAGVLGLGGMLALAAGWSPAQGPGGAPPPPAPGSGAPPGPRPTIAVFNMAAVMKDYGKAKYQVHLLNTKRAKMSENLVKLRGEYAKLHDLYQKNVVPDTKEAQGRQLLALTRQMEDEDRTISKALNEDATRIISHLYDEIKTVVDKTAEMNGYHIVFAYPDAVTPEDLAKPEIKELKLKPPAAQPFYVARHVDMTGVVVQTLNAWYPPKDDKGQPVDVTKLVDPPMPGAPPAKGP